MLEKINYMETIFIVYIFVCFILAAIAVPPKDYFNLYLAIGCMLFLFSIPIGIYYIYLVINNRTNEIK
jgi:Sec-independent protein secretion pathway component TatC